MAPLLAIHDLVTEFHTPEGTARAVDGVSLSLEPGQTLSLVGESGCGKTVTALSILGLIPDPPGRISGGRILFQGRDLLRLTPEELRSVRGGKIAMVFQEPMTSLNPVFTVGDQIIEAVALHQGLPPHQAREAAAEALAEVGIPDPVARLDDYPHQMSGGMRQRVMIAMALSCNPELLIADEPTTALDVTIQAQILELIAELQERRSLGLLLITHNLGVVAEIAHQAAVMYLGQVVENSSVQDLFDQPLHPYTKGLMASLPQPDQASRQLVAIPGMVPSIFDAPRGCRFADRCPDRFDKCDQSPQLIEVREGCFVRCHLYD